MAQKGLQTWSSWQQPPLSSYQQQLRESQQFPPVRLPLPLTRLLQMRSTSSRYWRLCPTPGLCLLACCLTTDLALTSQGVLTGTHTCRQLAGWQREASTTCRSVHSMPSRYAQAVASWQAASRLQQPTACSILVKCITSLQSFGCRHMTGPVHT